MNVKEVESDKKIENLSRRLQKVYKCEWRAPSCFWICLHRRKEKNPSSSIVGMLAHRAGCPTVREGVGVRVVVCCTHHDEET